MVWSIWMWQVKCMSWVKFQLLVSRDFVVKMSFEVSHEREGGQAGWKFMWRKSEIGVRMNLYMWVWQMASQSSGMQNSLLAAGADHRHLQDKQNYAPLSWTQLNWALVHCTHRKQAIAADVEFLIHHFAKIIWDWPIDFRGAEPTRAVDLPIVLILWTRWNTLDWRIQVRTCTLNCFSIFCPTYTFFSPTLVFLIDVLPWISVLGYGFYYISKILIKVKNKENRDKNFPN